jgi:hypothetical protein
MHRQSLRTALALLAAVVLVAGLGWAGRHARDWLDRRGHYDAALAAVDCPAPPGLTRAALLAEVQYLGGLPDRFSAADPAAAARLAAAFALHPWVEHVGAVQMRGPTGPRVLLTLRTPVLAAGGRVLDGHGVLLPAGAPADGLVRLAGDVPPAAGPAGAAWGDACVEGAARTAAALLPLQESLRLTSVEPTPEGLMFDGGVRVRWGRAVGADPGGEPAAAAKLARLRALCARPGETPAEIDLRHDP